MPPRRRNTKRKQKQKMPGLTVDTFPQTQAHDQQPRDDTTTTPRATSPVQPPYSPITPTLSAARLAPPSTSSSSFHENARPNDTPATTPVSPRPTYTHTQPQIAIPQPAPVPIAFDDNPDAIALKSAIAILQLQARNATNDIRTLQQVKERALQDPEGFTEALVKGELKSKGDKLFNPSPDDGDEEEDEDEDEDESRTKMNVDQEEKKEAGKKGWPTIPAPQNIVRCAPINWNQYAVVGESLDKIHKDQQERPSEGMPQRVGQDGQLLFGGEGQRRVADMGVAAPYQPGRDKIEKPNTKVPKKGGG